MAGEQVSSPHPVPRCLVMVTGSPCPPPVWPRASPLPGPGGPSAHATFYCRDNASMSLCQPGSAGDPLATTHSGTLPPCLSQGSCTGVPGAQGTASVSAVRVGPRGLLSQPPRCVGSSDRDPLRDPQQQLTLLLDSPPWRTARLQKPFPAVACNSHSVPGSSSGSGSPQHLSFLQKPASRSRGAPTLTFDVSLSW